MILTAVILGLSVASFAACGAVHANERNQSRRRRDDQVAKYILELTEENERLREENETTKEHLRSNLCRELGWLDERKRLNNRLKIAFKELAYDDSKKTRIMRRSV